MRDLRKRAVEGSLYMSLRRAFSIALSAVGMLYVTRVVGPENYGLFASVIGVYTFMTQIVGMGIRLYLVRCEEEHLAKAAHQALWWLVGFSGVLVLAALGLTGTLGRLWITEAQFSPVAVAVWTGLPLFAATMVSQALLERALRYRRMAAIDISAQIASYAVGIPLALGGYGVWALVCSFWAAILTTCTASYLSSRYVPRWYWNRERLRDMLQYAFAQAVSEWLYYAKNLAPALVLLPLAGKEAVGYFALAERLLNLLNFAQASIRGVTTTVLARVQKEPAKMLHVLYISPQAQILSLGGVSLLFVMGAWYLLPPLFGAEWDIRLAVLALALLVSEQLLTATFSTQAQALYVIRQPHVVTKAALLFVINFYWLTALLTYLAPKGYAVLGYGVANFLAHLPNNVFLHRGVSRYIGKPRYGMNLLWASALGVALFAPVAFYAPLLALGVFLLPASRRALRELLHEVRALRTQS
jgi:O-antigen/teichoic acid export membrane protein